MSQRDKGGKHKGLEEGNLEGRPVRRVSDRFICRR